MRLKGLVRARGSERPVLVQSVGTIFSAPRPFGAPHGLPPLVLVIIARDLSAGELEAVAPAGLFDFSSYTAPASLGSVQRFVGVA